jgi:hypothetical protein
MLCLNVCSSELLRKKLQEAYQKGLEDARKSFEAEKKNNSNVLDPATRAQQAKEAEARENARVQKLVTEISQKTYRYIQYIYSLGTSVEVNLMGFSMDDRAPIGEVQCSSEREACLQCYRENSSDVLKCKEVADAFIRCAQETTEVKTISSIDRFDG